MKQIFFAVISLLLILHSTYVQGACDMDELPSVFRDLPSDHPTTVPFWEGRAYGVAFAEFGTMRKPNIFSTRLTGPTDNQTVALHVKENFHSYLNEWRENTQNYVTVWLRCADGTRVTKETHTITFIDVSPTAPVFSSPSYTYSVSLPWPEAVPITHEWPIWVRDRDFNETMAQVTFSVDMPNIVTVRTSSYNDYFDEATDHKADLYLTFPQTVPGTYNVVITADDGFNRTTAPVTIIITEATCKTPAQNPSFGKFGSPVNFYKGLVSSLPSPGDLLDLNGQKINAYHPDPLCLIDLSVESDFLEINSDSEIAFSRNLSPEELLSLGPSYVTQIVAADKITGTSHKVPLFICFELSETVHKPVILQSN